MSDARSSRPCTLRCSNQRCLRPVDDELESLQRALAELNARASALQQRHDALEAKLLMVRVETPRVSTPVEQLQPWMTRGWSLLLMVSLLLLAVFLGQC